MKKLSDEQFSRQIQRERRNNNRFYERFAVILIFVLLIFAGISFCLAPKEKVVFKFDKINIEENHQVNEDSVELQQQEYPVSKEEINEDINYYQKPYSTKSILSPAQKKLIADIKRKDIQKILAQKQPKPKQKQRIYSPPPKLYYNTQTYESARVNDNILPPVNRDIVNYQSENPVTNTQNSGVEDDIFGIILDNTTCSREEIEYVLKLYSSINSKPLTLVFRKDGRNTSQIPEIIYATLPNNKWQSLQTNFENIMGSLLGEFLEDLNGNDTAGNNTNLTKVRALITTPCSDDQYVSQSFNVSSSMPSMSDVNYAQSFCSQRNGRLPDVLELISIFTHKKNMPRGFYITNSQRLFANHDGSNPRPSGEYLVIEYNGNNLYFSSSSKVRQAYAECVLR